MKPVLLHSRVKGKSGWIITNPGELLRASGLRQGDLVKVFFRSPCPVHMIALLRDGDYELPTGASYVQAEHVRCSGGSVCVDLVARRWDDAA